jgi:hypothetical protein
MDEMSDDRNSHYRRYIRATLFLNSHIDELGEGYVGFSLVLHREFEVHHRKSHFIHGNLNSHRGEIAGLIPELGGSYTGDSSIP